MRKPCAEAPPLCLWNRWDACLIRTLVMLLLICQCVKLFFFSVFFFLSLSLSLLLLFACVNNGTVCSPASPPYPRNSSGNKNCCCAFRRAGNCVQMFSINKLCVCENVVEGGLIFCVMKYCVCAETRCVSVLHRAWYFERVCDPLDERIAASPMPREQSCVCSAVQKLCVFLMAVSFHV